MPLLSSSLPNLINGVSQQAPGLRQASQMEAQDNAHSSIVEGLGKRQPTQHIARLGLTDISNAFIHTINRDATERYTVVVEDNAIRVYDMDGNAKTLTSPHGTGYINTTGLAKDVIKAVTVADYTFIVNTEKTTEVVIAPASNAPIQSLVFVRQGQYGTRYRVYIDGFLIASYTTSSTVVADIQTTNIAQELYNELTTNLGFNVSAGVWNEGALTLTETGAFTNYTWSAGDRIYIKSGTPDVVPGTYEVASKTNNNTIVLSTSISSSASNATTVRSHSVNASVTLRDSVILIEQDSYGDQGVISCSDSFGDRALTAVTETIQRFSDLPVIAPDGFTTQITGDNGIEQDNYWVTFQADEGTGAFSKGLWIESTEPDSAHPFDLSTMPHTLVRNGDGTFTFDYASWAARTVGDDTTAPAPSFVDSTIQDIFFFKNRLGFLSKDNVILSEDGSFFNFWPTTVTSVLDSDPIDVASTSTRAGLLRYAVPFREELILTSDQAQFVLGTTSGLLTASSVSISQSTEFDTLSGCRPVGAGKNIYFGFPRGSFSGVWEYFVQSDNSEKDAADITAHVPKYISGAISKITVSSAENVIAALSSTDQDTIYVYKFYWSNDQKLQSSWSKYTFETGAKVLNADFIESTLYLVVQRSDGNHLEKIQFEAGQTDSGSTYVTRLDRRLTEADVTISYNAGTNVTTWTLPYTITGTMRVVARAGDASLPEGARIQTLTAAGTTITATGDYSSSLVYIGQVYTMRVRFSEQIPREEARGGGQAQVLAGRNQIRYVTVSYNDTGYFSTEVTPTGRDTSEKVFTQVIPSMGGPALVTLQSGRFRFPVLAQTSQVVIELVSDSHLPCHFTGAEFETFFHTRSQRA